MCCTWHRIPSQVHLRFLILSLFVLPIFLSIKAYLLLIFWVASAQSTARIEELLQEDQNAKRRRERYQKQSSLLSNLTRKLSIHDNRAAAASNWSDGGGGGAGNGGYKQYSSPLC